MYKENDSEITRKVNRQYFLSLILSFKVLHEFHECPKKTFKRFFIERFGENIC